MYDARVLEVVIASPSDTDGQREEIRRAVIAWNGTNASFLGVVLLPVMWETHTYPDFSRPAQSAINRQIIDEADVLIATFWTTLGTPTGAAESGTIEEIERFLEAGKPVFVYFCEMPSVPMAIDTSDLERLKAYRERIKDERFFGSYRSLEELHAKVRDDLTRKIHEMREGGEFGGPVTAPIHPGRPSDGDSSAELEQLRRSYEGYCSKWSTVYDGLVDDISIDKRYSLMNEVEVVTLEVIRLVATQDTAAPVLPYLETVANDATRWSTFRVYMDGGKSFGELTNGCRSVLDNVRRALAEPWTSQA